MFKQGDIIIAETESGKHIKGKITTILDDDVIIEYHNKIFDTKVLLKISKEKCQKFNKNIKCDEIYARMYVLKAEDYKKLLTFKDK